MRTKSERRRQTIVETAAEAFRERGFEATSMSEVAARLGGSKATLYNYFCSKESLFVAVMLQAMKQQAHPIVDAFCNAPTVAGALRTLAPSFLRLMLQPDVLAITRMCVAEGERSGFGPSLYGEGPKPAWTRMAARIERAMNEGELRHADPWTATMHMLALCEAGLVPMRLKGWIPAPTEAEIDASAAAAAEAFIRAYAPDTPHVPTPAARDMAHQA